MRNATSASQSREHPTPEPAPSLPRASFSQPPRYGIFPRPRTFETAQCSPSVEAMSTAKLRLDCSSPQMPAHGNELFRSPPGSLKKSGRESESVRLRVRLCRSHCSPGLQASPQSTLPPIRKLGFTQLTQLSGHGKAKVTAREGNCSAHSNTARAPITVHDSSTTTAETQHRAPLSRLSPASHSQLSASSSLAASGDDAPSKRRCISSACMPCRKRKSKCNGVHPACHTCTTMYGSECYYDIDSDHRRKGALKRDIAQLKDDLGPRNMILDAIKNGSESDVDDIVQLIRSNPDESWDSIAENVKKISLAAIEKKAPSSYLERELADFSIKASRNPRQYGHTSNLSLIAEDEDIPTSAVNQLGTWTNVTNDNGFIKHLLDCYFSWGHPLYTIFSEEVFMHSMQDRKLKYCTPLLVNAVLAIGCHFSDRPEARANPNDPSTVGDHFYHEADRLLQEDKRPCLTTVQALAVMSIHQAMNNKDSDGWLLICRATGMVIELGLHKDQPGQSNGKITASEMAVRRITFWGYYFFQIAWSICAGRLSLLPRTAVRLEKPALLDHLENRSWKPHGHPKYKIESPLEQPGLRYTILLHTSSLCEIVDDNLQMFYAPRDRITSRRLQLYHEKFQAWYEALPETLAIKENGPTLPHIICLHIFYHNCVIQLFRPFIRVSFVQSAKTPKQICTESANRMSELMALYRKTYGLHKIGFMYSHCMMTAAIIHLVNMSGSNLSPEVFEQTDAYLVDAIRVLRALAQSFPIVERFIKAVRGLVFKWCTVVPPKVQEVISEIDMASASPTSSRSPTSQGVTDTNTNMHASHPGAIEERTPSAPDLLPNMGIIHDQPNPNSLILGSSQTQIQAPAPPSTQMYQQQIFWTPFPNQGDGIPLAPPPDKNHMNQNMDITSMLDSGIDGDWPQLNRDGFTMSGEDDAALWGYTISSSLARLLRMMTAPDPDWQAVQWDSGCGNGVFLTIMYHGLRFHVSLLPPSSSEFASTVEGSLVSKFDSMNDEDEDEVLATQGEIERIVYEAGGPIWSQLAPPPTPELFSDLYFLLYPETFSFHLITNINNGKAELVSHPEIEEMLDYHHMHGRFGMKIAINNIIALPQYSSRDIRVLENLFVTPGQDGYITKVLVEGK
ncbi:hypothetical protein G7Y89_g10314 [Cudoniella acicularis]|uniref:Zn(2)-C6 fungal-type domain-containing protein n=1 Tax=Cudoniella acicularis TaxID=354080 RepID=A0A8H4REL3_9HELO|nr:hypothetical protein G7Y89_g10314 [Cudoniella acicularis]